MAIDTVTTAAVAKASNAPADPERAAARRDRLVGAASPLFLLALWELAAVVGLVDLRFFPAPSAILVALYNLSVSGELLRNTAVSLERVLAGAVIGGIPALAIGLATGLYRPIRAAVNPLIGALYPIPKSALMPLIFLLFGLGEASKVAIVAIGVFFPIAINTCAGVLEISPIYLDVGRNFRASRWNTFKTIALPGALPFIMTGIKLGAGMGLVLIAVAEMVGAKSGLGYMIWNAWEIYAIETMYAGLFTIALIGFGLSSGLNAIERLIVPWKRRG
jgi:ABC-type nitrate/sulfonate/bicarbonate transport system permease component